jgi:hypothetical protein
VAVSFESVGDSGELKDPTRVFLESIDLSNMNKVAAHPPQRRAPIAPTPGVDGWSGNDLLYNEFNPIKFA